MWGCGGDEGTGNSRRGNHIQEREGHSSDEVHEVRFPRLFICVTGGKFLKVSDFSRNAFIKIKYSEA